MSESPEEFLKMAGVIRLQQVGPPPDAPPPRPVVRAELITLEDLKMEPIDWLWTGWLAHGKIHLIAGVPEAGKTSTALKLCATLSSGDFWPDGTRAKPGNVLIWTGEDNLAQTIKPRLIQMGADPKKISIVKATRDENGKPRPFNPSTDLPVLARAAKEIPGGVDMLIVDPIVSVIGGKLDNGNNAGHREKLQPLVDFGEEMNCVVIGITHFTKGTIGKDPIDRVTGSLAFGAVTRVLLVATKNKAGDPERMFIMAKNNLGPTAGGFGYSIGGAPLAEHPDIIASRVVWGKRIEGLARDLLAAAEDDGKGAAADGAEAAQEAQKFLLSALADGERPQAEIAAEGAAHGFSKDRIFRAARTLDVVKRKDGLAGGWLWKLPTPGY
jgi:putative DNA primase/helicase